MGVGFEPTVTLQLHTLSRRTRSTAPAPHLYFYFTTNLTFYLKTSSIVLMVLKPKSIKRTLSLIFLLSLFISIPISVYTVTTQRMETRRTAREIPVKQIEIEENLIRKYEPGDRKFEKIEISNKKVYFYQRMIEGAIVEKDFINYQFDRETKQLLKKTSHWRTGLPDHLPSLKVTEEQAKSMIKGEVQFANLYIISPESDIFPLDPTPENPCWIIASIENEMNVLTIIDAVTGKQLGYGIPPPSHGSSLSGPQRWIPCRGNWTAWYASARYWFQKMGYPTATVEWPTEGEMKGYIQNPRTTLFYEIAHGGTRSFDAGCLPSGYAETTSSEEVKEWMAKRRKMSFIFIASCGGLCTTEPGTFSYEFRKGSDEDSATVGYCGMNKNSCVTSCWSFSLPWQEAMFNYMYEGYSVKTAFDKALADYPVCGPPNNCMRFAGDVNHRVEVLTCPEICPRLKMPKSKVCKTQQGNLGRLVIGKDRCGCRSWICQPLPEPESLP